MKYKVRSYNFWISLASAVLLVLRILGQRFGFEIDSGAFMDIATAICGVLVVLGIITMPVSNGESKNKTSSKEPQVETETEPKKEAETEPKLAGEEIMQYAQNETPNEAICTQNANLTDEISNILDEVTKDKDISQMTDKELFGEVLRTLAATPEQLVEFVEQMFKK